VNPNKVIKPWLLIVGKQWGCTEAHDYRWSDAQTKQNVEYFTYKMTGMRPADRTKSTPRWNKKDDEPNTLLRKSRSQWITTVQIDIHRSQDGMAELARVYTAAEDDNPNIMEIFNKHGVGLTGEEPTIQNLTEIQQDDSGLRENYHHRMIINLYENITIELEESNEVVDQINVTLGEWDT
jgi:hypothetical protein